MDLGFFSCQGIKSVKENKGYLYILIILQVTVPFIKLVRRTGKRKVIENSTKTLNYKGYYPEISGAFVLVSNRYNEVSFI